MVGLSVSDLRPTPLNLEMLKELGTQFPVWQGVGKGKATGFLPRS